MIAEHAFEEDAPRSGTRAARGAAERRRRRTQRMHYSATIKTLSVLSVLTFAVVMYLGLLANVERLNIELYHAKQARTKLADESARLDDTIARLRSRERLAKIAAQLGMHDPVNFVAVTPPAERPAAPPPNAFAFLAQLR